LKPNPRIGQTTEPGSSNQQSAANGLHERLRIHIQPCADSVSLSETAVAALLLKISEAYHEHDRVAARLSQDLHVEVARRDRGMTRLRRITLQLLGSAGSAADLAGGADLEHLSELIARLVHEREEAKEQVGKSEERFRALTENALDHYRHRCAGSPRTISLPLSVPGIRRPTPRASQQSCYIRSSQFSGREHCCSAPQRN